MSSSILNRRIKRSTPIDPLVLAFINKGINTPSQINALKYLASQFRAYNLLNKLYAFYPIIGGTSALHSWNFIDVTKYQLTFNGTWTHSANGAFPNGTTGYATTGFIPNSVQTANDTSLFYYSRTDANNNSSILGAVSSATSQERIQPRNANLAVGQQYDATNAPTGSVPDSVGLFIASKIASNDAIIWKQNNLINRSTTCAGNLPTHQIYLGAHNSAGTAANFTTRGCIAAGIGKGLTELDCQNLNRILENFNYLLNRVPKFLPNVIYEGDSFFAGGVNIPGAINTYLTGLSYTVTSNNYAVSGSTVAYVNGTNYMNYSTRTSAVSALRNSKYFREIVAFWEGTNEINQYLNAGSTAAQAAQSCYDNYNTYAQLWNQTGSTAVLLNTVTPRGDAGANVNFENARTTFNAQILADFTIGTGIPGVYRSSLSKWKNTLLCDVGNSSAMGYAGAYNDTGYFNVDKLHPNASGVSYIANNFYGPALDLANNLRAQNIFN